MGEGGPGKGKEVEVAGRTRRQGQRRRCGAGQADAGHRSATSSWRTRSRTGSPCALVQNAAGKFVEPTIAVHHGCRRRRRGDDSAPNTDYRVSIVNAPGADAYPISSFTWLLVYQQQPDAAKGEEARRLHALGMYARAKQSAAALDYAPLPAADRPAADRTRSTRSRSARRRDRRDGTAGRRRRSGDAVRREPRRSRDVGIGDRVYRVVTTAFAVSHPAAARAHRARGRGRGVAGARTFGLRIPDVERLGSRRAAIRRGARRSTARSCRRSWR